MRDKIRFWHYGTSPVLITIHRDESLHYSQGGPTDEGWHRDSYCWSFDGVTLTEEWQSDGCDCDGRLTRGGVVFCRVRDLRAGNADPDDSAVVYPRWLELGPAYQRDFAAEAMGY